MTIRREAEHTGVFRVQWLGSARHNAKAHLTVQDVVVVMSARGRGWGVASRTLKISFELDPVSTCSQPASLQLCRSHAVSAGQPTYHRNCPFLTQTRNARRHVRLLTVLLSGRSRAVRPIPRVRYRVTALPTKRLRQIGRSPNFTRSAMPRVGLIGHLHSRMISLSCVPPQAVLEIMVWKRSRRRLK